MKQSFGIPLSIFFSSYFSYFHNIYLQVLVHIMQGFPIKCKGIVLRVMVILGFFAKYIKRRNKQNVTKMKDRLVPFKILRCR
jgi:hypothetical protein